MAPLTSDLRRLLERAVVQARRIGEEGARAALAALAVSQPEAHRGTPQGERDLRNRLRAHARQLGDPRDERSGTQEVDRLAHEVAYEHWHRMLFARFLAENGLLLHPEHQMPVTLEECRELARDEGTDPWGLASRYAQTMLPRIFRPDDPALAVALAPEHQGALERLLADLPPQVFASDDGLGWVYQFWQQEKKDEISRSGKKIGADELPAKTQLFTEHYLVLFLLHNTIGAWRAGKILAARPELARMLTSETELRAAVALPGYAFDYLRFVRETPDSPWRPAAGTYEGWPGRAAEIRALDPCCGSGHFLTAMLELLHRLRMEDEGLDAPEAIEAVLRDNLYGLELDPRCTQIAAFSLALAAWKTIGGWRPLPPVQVACSGLSVGGTRDAWLSVAGSDLRLRVGMERLYDLFRQAPVLGSLIDPRREAAGDFFEAGFEDLEPLLAQALRASQTPESIEVGVAAQGLARSAKILSDRFTLVITNVPYLGKRDQAEELLAYGRAHHSVAIGDLATVFVLRSLDLLNRVGCVAMVLPQNWSFLSSYTEFRRTLLSERTWHAFVRLGEHAFESKEAAGAFAAIFICGAGRPKPESCFLGLDVASNRGELPILAAQKTILLKCTDGDPRAMGLPRDGRSRLIQQASQLGNPDARVLLDPPSAGDPLALYASALQGTTSGDGPRYTRSWWEVSMSDRRWSYLQSPAPDRREFGGLSSCLLWEDGRGALASDSGARVQGLAAIGRQGILVGQMSSLPVTRYLGELFDMNGAAVIPTGDADLAAIWAFLSSPEFAVEVRKFDQKLNVTNATIVKVPFDRARWRDVAASVYPEGLPEPESDDPAQWIFHGQPAHSSFPLQVTVARLAGYRWPAESDDAMRLSVNARRLIELSRALSRHADVDGIVPLSSLRGEAPAGDRMRDLLSHAYGADWTAAKERELISATGSAEVTLEGWLRNDFFAQHCVLFHDRPFVWHVWDGRKDDGFGVLVNYHRLAEGQGRGKKTLEAITYGYLGEWIAKQEAARRAGEAGADARLEAASALKRELEQILLGEKPYDLFVRWKPLDRQAVGWEPDIDDGVRLNIRPFLSADLSRGGRAGAGVLRSKPNIKWMKDRGAEPEAGRPRSDFPWFWRGDEFTGERVNDVHLTLDEKRAARAAHERTAAKEGR